MHRGEGRGDNESVTLRIIKNMMTQEYLPVNMVGQLERPQDIKKSLAELCAWLNVACEGVSFVGLLVRLLLLLFGYVSEVSTLDWVVVGVGLFLIAIKLGMVIYVIVALENKYVIPDAVVLYSGLVILGFNLLFCGFYVLAIFLLGKLDPSGFLNTLFMTLAIIMGIEVLSVGLILLLAYPWPKQQQRPSGLGEYLPVLQLVP